MDVYIDYISGKCAIKCDIDFFKLLRESISAPNPGNRFSRFSPKRLYAITPAARFELGMLHDVVKNIKELDSDSNIELSDSLKDILSERYDDSLHYLPCNMQLHYYQKDIICKALAGGRGVCVLGTGGGKTLTIATLINSIYHQTGASNFKCILIVPDIGLVEQTYSDLQEYNIGLKCSKWSSENKLDINSNIIVCSSKMLISRFKYHPELAAADLLVMDECHKLKHGTSICKIIDGIETRNRFGFTGTLPPDERDRWCLKGKMGPVYFEKASIELRDEGFLAAASIKIISVKYKRKPPRPTPDENGLISSTAKYKAELDFLYNNGFRNNLIKTICGNFKSNILILVNNLIHVEILYNKLQEISDREVYYVQGSVHVSDREKIKKIMEASSGVIVVAMASVFSTGMNIKNVHMVMFASGGKAFVRIVQSIGRGLRLHESKDELIIVDIADQLKYGIDHMEKRLSIYDSEKIKFSINAISE